MDTGRTLRSPWAGALLTALAVGLGAVSCQRASPPRKPAATQTYDAHYIGALAAADEFCDAWRRRDVRTAKILLSRRVRRTFPDAQIQDAIAGPPSPGHAAYEISGGSRSTDGSFTFALRLFYRFAGRAQERIEARSDSIAVQRDDTGTWLVDRFPLLNEPK